MSDKYQYTLPHGDLHEIQTQPRQMPAQVSTLFSGLPAALTGFPALPADALPLGIASDGLPLVLDLRDPRPGAIALIAGQDGGKTDFLKALLLMADRLSAPGNIQFAVITDFPAEFSQQAALQNLLGVWPASQPVTSDLLYQLCLRVENPAENQPIIVLIDGLDCILRMEQADHHNLAYLLRCGPRALIWPIVTVNAALIADLPEWLALFSTWVFGRISDPRTAQRLALPADHPLADPLCAGQFFLRRGADLLKFQQPNLF